MKVRVLGFASAGDALGAGEVEIELPEGSDLAALRRRLDRDHPALAALWPRLAVAVDGSLAAAGEPLHDGAEVALLPPVSGGAGGEPRSPASGLIDGPLDPARAIAAVARPGRGAVLTFLGTVRDHHAGRAVERLTYTAYRPMAEAALGRIAGELEAAGGDLGVAIFHRLGEVPVGEASVVIVTASPHRAAAYDASRTALERLKAEVPIWKREHYAGGGAEWREEEPLTLAAPASPDSPARPGS